MTRTALLSLLIGTASLCATAQTRYLDKIFSEAQITVTSDVTYGTNVDWLTSDFSTVPPTINTTDVKFDVYQPDQTVDTETARPVIIYLHTGNLLPPPVNGSPTGLKTDSSAIYICREMARRGYVAISCQYRGGWNPLAPTESERKAQLLNAVYRAIHDVKQCVRTLRENEDAGGNTYHIDPSKFTLWGEGTGGYIALADVTLNDPLELYIPKFRPDILDPTVSYVDSNLVGNIDGYCPDGIPCLSFYQPNGYSSDVQMCVNMGGALADTSWLDDGDVPMVTMHTVRDDFAPFNSGRVVVPVTGEYVVDLQGPNVFLPLANSFGNNDSFATLPSGDPYTDAARALYGTTWSRYDDAGNLTTVTIANAEGLYPIVRPLRPYLANEASPWQWWDPASPLANVEVSPGVTTHMASLLSNPDMTWQKGRAYSDSCMGYAVPRIVCALDLGPCSLVGISESSATAQGVTISPNPSHGPVRIVSAAAEIHAYDLYDVNSRLVRSARVNGRQLTLDHTDLQPGAYLIQLHFEEGSLTRKLVIE